MPYRTPRGRRILEVINASLHLPEGACVSKMDVRLLEDRLMESCADVISAKGLEFRKDAQEHVMCCCRCRKINGMRPCDPSQIPSMGHDLSEQEAAHLHHCADCRVRLAKELRPLIIEALGIRLEPE